MKYILEWIWRQTPPQHQVRISSYRHLDLEHFLRGPEPCPFCLALSLWFFDVAARIFGRYYVDDIDNYPFLIQGGGSGFCDAEDPYLWTPHNGQYALDVRFANWFYGWNMEIVFARLFLFCEALACHVRTLGREHERRRIASADSALGFYHGDGFPGQACVIEYVHDKLNFYYESEHPITTCSVFRNEELSRECGRYHRYLFETLDVVEPFDYEVRTNEFSFEVFLSLMSKFIHFLQDRLSTKGRGNIEKGLCPLVPHSDRSRDSAPGRRTSHQLQNRYMVGAEFRALMVEGRDPGPERAKRFPDGLADLGAPWHG